MNQIAMPAPREVSHRRAEELIGWLRQYASDRINSRLIDERRCIPPYIILDFGNRGLLGMQAPEAYGGLALQHADHLRVLEQLAAIDLTLALVVFNHGINGIRPIQGYATPAVREEFLSRLAGGRELAAFALSEPGAGSNLGAIASHARPDGRGGWRIQGLKRWNSSSWAGVVSVFVRQVGENGRLGGLTGFVVRQGSPGLKVGPEALTMGMRGSVQNSLFLDDVPAGPEDLLGDPGRGAEVAEDALTIGRLYISSLCLGGLKRCAQLLVRFGGRRNVASGKLLENSLLLASLGDLTRRISVVEALRDQIAMRLDNGRSVPPEVPMAVKVVGTDSLNLAAGRLMQWLGSRGYMENNLAPQILRDGRALSITEGPNEPLTIQVGRKARLTDAIDGYLRADPAGSELADLLKASTREITDRCVNRPGPFADRSTAQLWADWLVGQVASDTLLLAAVRQARSQIPSDHLVRAVGWAEIRLARSLERARKGDAAERMIPTPSDTAATVAHYAASIGDVEETIAGEDDALDLYVSKKPGVAPYPPAADLPGYAVVPEDVSGAEPRPEIDPGVPVSGEARRDRLAQVLRQRLDAAKAGHAET